MSSSFQTFKALHHSGRLFVLPNIWDAQSAVLAEKAEFPAVATSSAAVAESLGYEDGEQMPFADYLFVVKRILASVHVPLTVDMEMGYGKSREEIYANLQRLVDLGVAGINIEDSSISKGIRSLREAGEFATMIQYLKTKLESQKAGLFINIRCDTYLLNIEDKQKETARRLKTYASTGADGVFLPCISDEGDIAEATGQSQLPVSVMCIPGLPDFEKLNKLGVKRASMGPFLFRNVYGNIDGLLRNIQNNKSFAVLIA
jgi:2-methylisocitrate lyase-like PEP mutase family enzyme